MSNDEGPSLVGTYSGVAFLTVSGTYVPTGADVPPTSCTGSLTIRLHSADTISGTFQRGACTGLPRTQDVSGTFVGTAVPDEFVTILFSEPLLSTSEAFSTAGGCTPVEEARGPYLGRISLSSLTMDTAELEVSCCCATRPGTNGVIVGPTPSYSATYQVRAAR